MPNSLLRALYTLSYIHDPIIRRALLTDVQKLCKRTREVAQWIRVFSVQAIKDTQAPTEKKKVWSCMQLQPQYCGCRNKMITKGLLADSLAPGSFLEE